MCIKPPTQTSKRKETFKKDSSGHFTDASFCCLRVSLALNSFSRQGKATGSLSLNNNGIEKILGSPRGSPTELRNRLCRLVSMKKTDKKKVQNGSSPPPSMRKSQIATSAAINGTTALCVGCGVGEFAVLPCRGAFILLSGLALAKFAR